MCDTYVRCTYIIDRKRSCLYTVKAPKWKIGWSRCRFRFIPGPNLGLEMFRLIPGPNLCFEMCSFMPSIIRYALQPYIFPVWTLPLENWSKPEHEWVIPSCDGACRIRWRHGTVIWRYSMNWTLKNRNYLFTISHSSLPAKKRYYEFFVHSLQPGHLKSQHVGFISPIKVEIFVGHPVTIPNNFY